MGNPLHIHLTPGQAHEACSFEEILRRRDSDLGEAEAALRIAIAWGYLVEAEIRDGLNARDHFQAIARRPTS